MSATTTSDPLARTLFDIPSAFNRGDLSALSELVAPDVVYRIPGRAAVSGDFRGIGAVTDAFRRLRDLSDETIAVAPQLVLSDGDHVVFTARVTAERDGRSLDVVNAYAFRFAAGKLAAGQLFPGDLHAIEAFFG
jgi:ketosteroid isomerase-like protein